MQIRKPSLAEMPRNYFGSIRNRQAVRFMGQRTNQRQESNGSNALRDTAHSPSASGGKARGADNCNKMAGKPVSRILFGAQALTPACRSDHSSRSRFAPGLQQPTRGS